MSTRNAKYCGVAFSSTPQLPRLIIHVWYNELSEFIIRPIGESPINNANCYLDRRRYEPNDWMGACMDRAARYRNEATANLLDATRVDVFGASLTKIASWKITGTIRLNERIYEGSIARPLVTNTRSAMGRVYASFGFATRCRYITLG